MLEVKANCKINVHLAIMGKREDGYHELETIFQEIPLYDIVKIELIDEDAVYFSSEGIEIPICDENICTSAAKLLKRKYNISSGCKIHLIKKVPIGAGLGGGSSDGAAVLKGLNKLWKLELDDSILEEISVGLGADVPFFIKGGTSFATGIGEKLTTIKNILKNRHLVVVYPNIHVDTSLAYRNLKYYLTKFEKNSIFSLVLGSEERFGVIKDSLRNDFEAYVFDQYPEMKNIKQKIVGCGAEFSLMSGSGSVIYGVFDNYTDAKKAVDKFEGTYFVELLTV